jgi:type VI protein secretion system component VasK
VNQVLLDVFEGRLDRIAGRVTTLAVMLTFLGGLVVALALWTVHLTRELDVRREEAVAMQAALDSLQVAHRAMDLGLTRLDRLEQRTGRLGRSVRPSELLAVRGWVSRLEARIASNEEYLATLGARMDEPLRVSQDSIVSSPADSEAPIGAGPYAGGQAQGGP